MRTFILFTSDEEIAVIGRGLLDRTLPKTVWTHAAHFAATLWLIHCRSELEASREMPHLIRAYNEATGGANTDSSGYHETITQASIRAARAFLSTAPPQPLFVTCNALLLSHLGEPDWLLEHWTRATILCRGKTCVGRTRYSGVAVLTKDYSWRRASTGSIPAARTAGRSPETTPTAARIPNETSMMVGEARSRMSPSWFAVL